MVFRFKNPFMAGVLAWFFLTACGGAISDQVRDQVDPGITFQDVVNNPLAHNGRTVIFSGTILETINNKEGTLFIVLQRPAEPGGRPIVGDKTGGRFLAQDSRYLDPAIYAPGRALTVAGEVTGEREMPVGEIAYRYPVLAVKELHLWRPRSDVQFGFGFGTYHQFFRYSPFHRPYYDPWDDPWGW